MARKEINVFSVSFLDLLSGALGAVLILFIIIPKMTAEQQDAMHKIEELNVQMEQLEDLIEQVRNSIPIELYEQIQAQIDALQQTVEQLTDKTQQLQRRIAEVERENAQLREQLAQAQQQLEAAHERQRKQDGLPSDLAHKGDVEFFIMWEENVDVDLYVKNLGSGETCQHPGSAIGIGNNSPNIRSWGILTEDINNERLRGDGIKYYEIFYQPKPVPGRYQIYFNIFDDMEHRGRYWNGQPATISGFAIIYPGKPNEKRINMKTVTLTAAMRNHIVGTLEVTENSINLIQ